MADQQQQLMTSMTIVYCIKFTLASLTIITASTLVVATFKSRTLWGPCNLLLAANAACMVLYSTTFGIQLVTFLLAGTQGISVRICCLLQVIPVVGNYGQYIFFALIALDRLISVLLPIWARGVHLYIQEYRQLYIITLFCSGFGFGLGASLSSIVQAFTSDDRIATCETGTATPQYLSNIGMVLSITASVFYLSLLLAFILGVFESTAGLSSSVKRDKEYTRKLLRSLMTMFLLEIMGWSGNQIATKVLNYLGYASTQRWFIKSYVGFLTQTTLMLYAPVLFLMSTEYRRAFRQLFGKSNSTGVSIKIVVPPAGSRTTQTRNLSIQPQPSREMAAERRHIIQ